MSDIALERIREAIVTGELAPGSKIKDSELAEYLGLSRTPVREALARLVDTGLVEAKPGAYTRITTLDRGDVEATLAVIEALDQLAVVTAVPNLTDEMIGAMRSANKDFAAAVKRNDIGRALTAGRSPTQRHHRRCGKSAVEEADSPGSPTNSPHLLPQVLEPSRQPGLRRPSQQADRAVRRPRCRGGQRHCRPKHRRHLGGLIGELFDADEFALSD